MCDACRGHTERRRPTPHAGKARCRSRPAASAASSTRFDRLPSRHAPSLLIPTSRITQNELAARNRFAPFRISARRAPYGRCHSVCPRHSRHTHSRRGHAAWRTRTSMPTPATVGNWRSDSSARLPSMRSGCVELLLTFRAACHMSPRVRDIDARAAGERERRQFPGMRVATVRRHALGVSAYSPETLALVSADERGAVPRAHRSYLSAFCNFSIALIASVLRRSAAAIARSWRATSRARDCGVPGRAFSPSIAFRRTAIARS